MANSLPRVLRDSASILNADGAALLLRLAFGGFMLINHGWPKLQGFEEKSQTFFNFLGLGSAASLGLAIFAEVVCALLVVIGLGTRWALVPLLITMLVAAFGREAPFAKMEAALTYLFAYGALFLLGSGRYSVDAAMRKS